MANNFYIDNDIPSYKSIVESYKKAQSSFLRLKDILNKPIIIRNFKVVPSHYYEGECLHIDVEFNGKMNMIITGSKVIRDQLEKIEDRLPISATVIFCKKYYKLT